MIFQTQLEAMCRTARLTALGLAMASAPSPAWADFFGTPVAVSPADKSAIENIPIVFHPSFGYLPTWQLFFEPDKRIQTRSRSTLGVFGPIQTISPAGGDATDAHVAVDADGNASYVWSFDNGVDSRIQTRTRSPAGTLGPTSTLSPPGEDCYEPKVALRAAGRKVFTFNCGAGSRRFRARTRSAAGVLGPTLNVSPASGAAYVPQVVVEGDGDVLFGWLYFNGTTGRVQVRPLSSDDVLGPIQNISPAGSDTDFPHLATTPDGKAVITWQHYNASFSEAVIETRTRSPAGALSAVVPLTPPGTYSEEPKVALDAAGDMLFAWTLRNQPNARIQARHRSAAGVLRPTQNISAATGFAFDVEVARNADGDAVLAWTTEAGGNHRVQVRTRADNGPLGPIETLFNAPYQSSFPRPDVVLNDDGNALISFSRYNGTNERIFVAAGP